MKIVLEAKEKEVFGKLLISLGVSNTRSTFKLFPDSTEAVDNKLHPFLQKWKGVVEETEKEINIDSAFTCGVARILEIYMPQIVHIGKGLIGLFEHMGNQLKELSESFKNYR